MLDMADKLVGGFFAKARNTTRQRYVASAGNVGRLMRLFHGTIDALAAAQEAKPTPSKRWMRRWVGQSCCVSVTKLKNWPTSLTKILCFVPQIAGGHCTSLRPL